MKYTLPRIVQALRTHVFRPWTRDWWLAMRYYLRTFPTKRELTELRLARNRVAARRLRLDDQERP